MKRHLRALILMMVFVFGIFNLCSFADTEYSLTVIQNGMRITTRKVPGTNITLSSKSDKITGWIVEEGGVTVTNNSFIMPSANVSIRANYQKTNVAVNAPVLIDGLTPVNWNGSAWETTTESNWDYNYNSVAEATHSLVAGNGDGKWANAQTADGSLYVWIPRYSYKITSGEHKSGNSWNSLDNPGTNKIEVKFSNGTTDDTSDSYIKHPAFTFGTDELQGIWVAKYEASQGNTTSETSVPTSSTSVAKSIPGVASWRNITVSKMFDYAYNTYRNADSHLMKNVEWGAVAYLTNAIGRIPYVNNSSTYIIGNAGGSQDATSATGTTNAWNTANGVKASTTHNVYGIYDMSGGAWEYVSAYYKNGSNSYINSLTSAADKYVDRYNGTYTSSNKGDAVYETSSSSSGSNAWDGDSSYTIDSSNPIFARGGYPELFLASREGIFHFRSQTGSAASGTGFRVVLTGVQPTASTTYTITYNLDGGTVTGNPTSYTSNDTITLVNPTKEGYTFTGWTGSNGTTPSTTVTIAKGSTGNKTYTANWTINTYTITATAGANGTITPSGTITVSHGSNQTFNIAPNAGYVLSELKIDGNAVTTASSYTFENVTSNHTITATFSPISYTISYNLDGGTVSGNPTSYTIEDAMTLVNPTKDGYNFTGWTGTGLTEATTTVTIAKGSTGDRTYTANWEVANVAPTTPTVTLSSKTTNSFNVRAVSTDANGDSLIYKLYVDGSLKSTSASTQSGTATTLSVTGLGEYTSHNYYVTVSDGTLTTTSSTNSVRTYCSGNNCSGSTSTATCTTCEGTGHRSCGGTLSHKEQLSGKCPTCDTYFNSRVNSGGKYSCSSCKAEVYAYYHTACNTGYYYARSSKNNEEYISYSFTNANYNYDNVSNWPKIRYHRESNCTSCNGSGTVLKCYKCNNTFSQQSSNHCSHGYTNQH